MGDWLYELWTYEDPMLGVAWAIVMIGGFLASLWGLIESLRGGEDD